MPKVGAVVIGRNEGERLRRCLATVQEQVDDVVYVDSGSSDGSVAYARSLGIVVVELDRSTPFSAARARNEGAEALKSGATRPDYLQFVDGDCQLTPGWIEIAKSHLEARPELGIVAGWRAEVNPEGSVYNAMCDFEWHRPAGPAEVCDGTMMVRADAFYRQGGFNPKIIAAEDDEFCLRIRESGLGIERLPVEMCLHDVAMTRFSEWWRRAVRAGHGFAEVGALHPQHFRAERKRVWLFGCLLPLVGLVGLVLVFVDRGAIGWLMVALVLFAYLLSWIRTVGGLRKAGLPIGKALHHGVFLLISKFPNLIGTLKYHRRRLSRQDAAIIEYK